MRFQLLGPVQASDGGRSLDLGPRKQRALLALLLLEDRPVSLARAVDELWADPPATAPKMVQMYVSGLRRALGADSIRTTRAGYELDANGADVDVRRFRSLRETAEREPALAASVLREALELWQGEPLSDLVGEPFADRERARLEDERLDAEEDRMEAELDLGNRGDIVELQALVARHPYRERLRRLLILALYRAGRQAEALDAYQDAVRVLRDDLGLEPSRDLRDLELAILRQDPSLDALHAEAPAQVRRPRRRRLAAAALAAAALGIAVGAVLASRGSTDMQITANHAAALDPETGKVTNVVPVGLEPTAITSVGDRVYVASGQDNAVLVFDAVTGRRIRSIPVGGTVTALSGAGRSLWAVEFYNREILRIPIDGAGEAAPLPLPSGSPLFGAVEHPVAITASPAGAWIGTDGGRVFFARAGGELRRVAQLDLPIRALAYAPPFLWIAAPRVRSVVGYADQPGEVVRLDLRTKATQSVPVGIDPSALAIANNGVWAATQADGKVTRVDRTVAPADIVDLHTTSLAEGPCSSGLPVSCTGSLVVSGHAVWAPSAHDRSIYRVDTRSGAVTRIRTQGVPAGITTTPGRIWVAAG